MLQPASLFDVCVRYLVNNLDRIGDELFKHIPTFPERLTHQITDYMYTISALRAEHLTAVNPSALYLPNISQEELENLLPLCVGYF